MELSLEVEEPFNLDLSLAPSFVSSLYLRLKPKVWVKIAGRLANKVRLMQVSNTEVKVFYDSTLPKELIEETVELEIGAWHSPFEFQGSLLSSSVRPIVEALASAYPGVRLPLAPWDFVFLFIAVSLSRRTDYERFVLRWCRRIWDFFGEDPLSIAEASPNVLSQIGSSYQVAQLQVMVRDLLSIPNRLEELSRGLGLRPIIKYPADLVNLNPNVARVLLLRACRYLGPKAVDSLILSSFKAPTFIPCDVHLKTVTLRLGLVQADLTFPEKAFCKRFSCSAQPLKELETCPRSNRCLRSSLSWLGELGGWFQTLCYIHGSSTCRTATPRCDECSLKNLCHLAK